MCIRDRLGTSAALSDFTLVSEDQGFQNGINSCNIQLCDLSWLTQDPTGSNLFVTAFGTTCDSSVLPTFAAMENCIENMLTTNGVLFSNVVVTGTATGQVTGLQIMGTDSTLADYAVIFEDFGFCLLYTSPSPRDATLSRMPSSA